MERLFVCSLHTYAVFIGQMKSHTAGLSSFKVNPCRSSIILAYDDIWLAKVVDTGTRDTAIYRRYWFSVTH